MAGAIEAILEKYGLVAMMDRLDAMEPSKVQSVLLAVCQRLAGRQTPLDLLRKYEQNRFVAPGKVPPQRLLRAEAMGYALLPPAFEPITLSPVTPLGSASVFGSVSQHKVVSACRGVEVIADGTNALALECALRRKREPARAVHLCAAGRNTRAQRYESPGASAHFSMLSLCSAGREEKDTHFTEETLLSHIRYHGAFLRAALGGDIPLTLVLSTFGRKQSGEIAQGIALELESEPGLSIAIRDAESGGGYYDGFRFQYAIPKGEGGLSFLADGGPCDWISRMLSDRREKLVTSGMPLEALGAMMEE